MTERDPRISDIFYYFEEHTDVASGRAHGRKIGVMQEIILLKHLMAHPTLGTRLYLERFLEGASGTSHKVEFAWYEAERQPPLHAGDEVPGLKGLTVAAVRPEAGEVRMSFDGSTTALKVTNGFTPPRSPTSAKARAWLNERELDLRLQSFEGDACVIDVVHMNRLLASLESKRVGAQRFAKSDKLGSGIQTIEKAKQASLVAIDLSRKWNGDPYPVVGDPDYISLVALGNGVHWTEKDRKIFAEYVDYTYTVKDSAIIRYFEFVEQTRPSELAQIEHFTAYFQGMTKFIGDGFTASDEDFIIVEPSGESRALTQVLADHLERVNPL